MTNRYWLTPHEVYAALDSEFHFDFDPCPYPLPDGYNSLALPWGRSNYVNPPFCRKDAPFGGPSAFARKAIAERDDGKTSVLILPVPNSLGLLLEAGAELRYGGRINWLDADTKEPCKVSRWQVLAILVPRVGGSLRACGVEVY
jgi:hypothetical protein